MIWKGFRFGLFLQIAVGPICVFIFQTATTHGFWLGEVGVLGVTIVDVFYILAAIFGIGAILHKYKKMKVMIQYIGAAVLIAFGLSNIISFFSLSLIPSLDFLAENGTKSVFGKTLVLTLSNPLTILFWAGVFSTKIAEDGIRQKELFSFGLGAVLSTLLFLTMISILGSFLTIFFDPFILKILNLIVGIVLVAFGIKAVVRRG